MKYGESIFYILYLVFAITAGCVILRKARNKTEKKMGIASLMPKGGGEGQTEGGGSAAGSAARQ